MILKSLYYRFFYPESSSDIRREWHDCILQIHRFSVKEKVRIVKITCFADIGNSNLWNDLKEEIRNMLSELFYPFQPTFSLIPQPPEKPYNFVTEAGYLEVSEDTEILHRSVYATDYVVIKTNNYRELWVSGCGTTEEALPVSKAGESAFGTMLSVLAREGFSIDNVVRQWNYIGQITASGNGGKETNYDTFNRTRYQIFHKCKKEPGYPAATGIGMKLKGVIIDFMALQSDDSIKIISVENPRQRNAYQYQPDKTKSNGTVPFCPPLFERAKLLTSGRNVTLWISGTASIIGQQTVGVNNPKEQVTNTLQNIQVLCSQSLRGKKYTDESDILKKARYFRIYVKAREQIPYIRSLCGKYFSPGCILFLEADICRDELLVEMEGEIVL
jgi:enamine deaminase RidA (YjgF/YER057c/UK114 family)